ncbi:unnamed protein product [Enterobius vermicularis]|uniref:Uncharacterized protein n=1 Tax=Enterobius vermicularis TaxID=51028 RepID=A0A0N4VK22_ENTVE|nr:unnamed protein product [Enterobius vermicularis]
MKPETSFSMPLVEVHFPEIVFVLIMDLVQEKRRCGVRKISLASVRSFGLPRRISQFGKSLTMDGQRRTLAETED